MNTSKPPSELPEFVYLVKPVSEWPVTAIACTEAQAPGAVDRAVAKRRESPNVGHDGIVQIWRARLCDITAMEIVPARMTTPELMEKP